MLLGEPGMHFRSHLFPRNRLDLSGFNLPYAALDLFGPSCFYPDIRLRFETLEKKAREFRTFSCRQLDCLSIKFLKSSNHWCILPRVRPPIRRPNGSRFTGADRTLRSMALATRRVAGSRPAQRAELGCAS